MNGLSGVVKSVGAGLDVAPLALLQAPAIKRLPGVPLHERLLLENPWPLMLICGLAGVVALMVLRSRGRVRAAIGAAAGAVLLGGLIWGLASTVRTDREIMRSQSLELVDAVATADTAVLDRLLAVDVVAEDPRSSRELDKEGIKARVVDAFGPQGSYPIQEHRVIEVEAVLDGPRVGRTQVRTSVVSTELGAPIGSWWRVDWRRDEPGGWRVIGVTPIWVQGLRLAE